MQKPERPKVRVSFSGREIFRKLIDKNKAVEVKRSFVAQTHEGSEKVDMQGVIAVTIRFAYADKPNLAIHFTFESEKIAKQFRMVVLDKLDKAQSNEEYNKIIHDIATTMQYENPDLEEHLAGDTEDNKRLVLNETLKGH